MDEKLFNTPRLREDYRNFRTNILLMMGSSRFTPDQIDYIFEEISKGHRKYYERMQKASQNVRSREPRRRSSCYNSEEFRAAVRKEVLALLEEEGDEINYEC